MFVVVVILNPPTELPSVGEKLSNRLSGEASSKKKALPSRPFRNRSRQLAAIPSGIGACQSLRIFILGQRTDVPLSNSFLAQLRLDPQWAIALSRPMPGKHLSVTAIALIALTLKFNDDVIDQFVRKSGFEQLLPEFGSAVFSPGEISETGRFNRLSRVLLLGQMSSSISSTALCPPTEQKRHPRFFPYPGLEGIRNFRTILEKGFHIVLALTYPISLIAVPGTRFL